MKVDKHKRKHINPQSMHATKRYEEKQKTTLNPYVATAQIIGLYLVMGFLWILLSDKLLEWFIEDTAVLLRLQLAKGWFYVLITAIIFYFIIKRRINLYKETIDEIYYAYQTLDDAYKRLVELGEELQTQYEIIEDAKNALLISEQRYELAAEGSTDGIWDWNIESGAYFFSKNWKKNFGYEENELENTFDTWKSLLHPSDLDNVIQKHQAYFARKSDEIYENTFRIRKKDGEYRWILSRGKAIFDESGTPIRMAGSHTDITEKMVLEQELYRLAYTDTLTDLPNKTKLEEQVNILIENHRTNNQTFAFVYVDIDDFKHINDTKGHVVGDVLLKQIAALFTSVMMKPNMVSRLGGDEFALVFPKVEDSAKVIDTISILLDELKKPWRLEGQDFYISGSFGVAFYPNDGDSFTTLLQNADAAMYASKTKGKDQIQLFTTEIRDRNLHHIKMVQELRNAIDGKEFVLHYQPVVSAIENRIVGVEALIRWIHPQQGFVAPLEFIPIAEKTGYIYQIDEWVFQEAFAQKKKWGLNGASIDRISVNISAISLRHEKLVEQLERFLEESGIDRRGVIIEVTETAVMEDFARAIEVLERIRTLGILIALDDFGSGYSSLTNLQKLPIDILKIDRDFIREITKEQEESYIVKSIIELAHHLGLRVVAEGVETKEQMTILRQYGCDYMQGFYFYKPQPVDQLSDVMHAQVKKERGKIS